jgi:hypothetical protein
MNPTHSRVITFCSQLEQKLDKHLFSQNDEDERRGMLGTVAKGAAATGGAIYGGSAIKRGLAPMIADRRSGMRSMIPGFTQKGRLAQTAAATGTVLRDKPLAVMRSVGATVGQDLRRAGSAAGRVASPILARLRGLAGKVVGKAA